MPRTRPAHPCLWSMATHHNPGQRKQDEGIVRNEQPPTMPGVSRYRHAAGTYSFMGNAVVLAVSPVSLPGLSHKVPYAERIFDLS